MENPILEYGRDKPRISRVTRISGWIALLSAAALQPLDLYAQLPYASGNALLLALACGMYAAITSRGKSLPAWGALAIIFTNFAS